MSGIRAGVKPGTVWIAEIAAFLLFVLFTPACVALITGLHLPFAFDRSFSAREFLQLWIVTLLVE